MGRFNYEMSQCFALSLNLPHLLSIVIYRFEYNENPNRSGWLFIDVAWRGAVRSRAPSLKRIDVATFNCSDLIEPTMDPARVLCGVMSGDARPLDRIAPFSISP